MRIFYKKIKCIDIPLQEKLQCNPRFSLFMSSTCFLAAAINLALMYQLVDSRWKIKSSWLTTSLVIILFLIMSITLICGIQGSLYQQKREKTKEDFNKDLKDYLLENDITNYINNIFNKRIEHFPYIREEPEESKEFKKQKSAPKCSAKDLASAIYAQFIAAKKATEQHLNNYKRATQIFIALPFILWTLLFKYHPSLISIIAIMLMVFATIMSSGYIDIVKISLKNKKIIKNPEKLLANILRVNQKELEVSIISYLLSQLNNDLVEASQSGYLCEMKDDREINDLFNGYSQRIEGFRIIYKDRHSLISLQEIKNRVLELKKEVDSFIKKEKIQEPPLR